MYLVLRYDQIEAGISHSSRFNEGILLKLINITIIRRIYNNLKA
jgi:hypothetical protein